MMKMMKTIDKININFIYLFKKFHLFFFGSRIIK